MMKSRKNAAAELHRAQCRPCREAFERLNADTSVDIPALLDVVKEMRANADSGPYWSANHKTVKEWADEIEKAVKGRMSE